MRKSIVVAVREYQAAVRTRAFLVTLFAMPVLMGGSMFATLALKGRVDTRDKRIAVLDRSGVLFDHLDQAAAERNRREIFARETGRQIMPRYVLERVLLDAADPSPTELARECEAIRAGKRFALVVIGPEVEKVQAGPTSEPAESGFKTVGTIDVYSDATSMDEFPHWLRGTVNRLVQERRIAEAGLPKETIEGVLAPVRVESLKPLRIDAQTGAVIGGTKKTAGMDIFVPMAVMFLMFMVISIGALPLLSSVQEEKMQRIAEVLLGSVQPFALMAGKLIGMVGVSMTILTVYLGGGVLGALGAGQGEFLPSNLTALVIWFIIFQGLAVLMFGAIFIAIGAACSDMKEAQSLFLPVWIVVCAPMFVMIVVLREPAGTLSTVLSLIPTATPMLMVMRLAAMPSIPVWQPMLGMVLVMLTTVFSVFVAGRIFRVGLLMQGKGAKFADLVRWALRG
jgi:ABC-2 type transport system permease protein